jgi:hypothetical protein
MTKMKLVESIEVPVVVPGGVFVTKHEPGGEAHLLVRFAGLGGLPINVILTPEDARTLALQLEHEGRKVHNGTVAIGVEGGGVADRGY